MNNLFCVIMAGGIGCRFWPMSTEERPKQFIDILGTGKTFIRHTYERFRPMVDDANFVVVTSERYKDLVLQEIPELKPEQVLCEPMRRNTAPCIAYAAYNIHAKNPNAVMVVTPSDHLVLNQHEFEAVIGESADFAASEDVLMTIGIKPSHPETGYGYIQVGGNSRGERCFKVKSFTEKPNIELAKIFVDSGEFFWNSGIFVWSVSSIMSALKKYTPDIDTLFERGRGDWATEKEGQTITSIYPVCPNISIDYGVMEKADNVHVICADFGWSDVGTWSSLLSLSQKDESGNLKSSGSIYTTNCSNSIVRTPKGKQVVIDSLDGYIVADSDDKLLICPVDNEQMIKEYVEKVKVLVDTDK